MDTTGFIPQPYPLYAVTYDQVDNPSGPKRKDVRLVVGWVPGRRR
jgi:hypothetical protein